VSEQVALVKGHIDAMMAEAAEKNIPADIVGRTLLNEVIEIYRRTRSNDDISSELRFVADNLDPDTDFEFMRP